MTEQVAKMRAAGTTASARKPSRAAAKAERRLQLIDATIRCIAKHGLSATTIAKVSDIAGTSVGLANFHFESKEKLLEATLQHLADEQRDFWKGRFLDPGRSLAERLTALVESRFDARVCDRKTLAVWFAFWGDAGARAIYRRVVADVDDERLDAGVAILTALCAEPGHACADPMETALGMEAFFDGLWLNMMLYPNEFRRLACRDRALDYIAALFPAQFPDRLAQTSAAALTDATKDKIDAP